jgi:lysophospholipase L1-like esterase
MKILLRWALLLVVSLAIFEAGARFYVTRLASPQQFSKYASLRQYQDRAAREGAWGTRLIAHIHLPFVDRPSYDRPPNRHNALGFRGDEITQPKPEGEFRIACLGASTTYTTSVEDYKLSYPALLEKELRRRGNPNVSVINAGTTMWSSFDTLINFQLRVLDLDPDLIIVYHAFSDLMARLVWPPEAYRGDNSGTWTPNYGPIQLPPAYEEITLLRILLIEAGVAQPHSVLGVSTVRRAKTNYKFQLLTQLRRGTYPAGIFKTTSVSEMLKANPPIYFRRNIENLVALARFRDIDVVLVTYTFSPGFEDSDYVRPEELLEGLAENVNIVRSISREMNVPLFDLAAVFPTHKKYFAPRDPFHVNQDGARVKASLFADFLIEERLVPAAAAGSD